MGRRIRDARLETREARSKPPQRHNPYWRLIHEGLHLGYRKGPWGGVWTVRQWKGGKYQKHRLGPADDAHDPDGAKILSFAQAQQRALKDAGLAERRAYTVADALHDYQADYAARVRSTVAAKQQQYKAQVIERSLGTFALADLTTEIIGRWHADIAQAPATHGRKPKVPSAEKKPTKATAEPKEAKRRRQASANRLLGDLKACLNFAWKHGKVDSDAAWRRVKKFKGADVPRVRYLTVAETRRLLNASQGEFRSLVRGALETGCRYGELCELRVRDYNPDSGTLAVHHTKGGHDRHVPLTANGQAFFENLTAGRATDALIFTHEDETPWLQSHQFRPMREACKAARIKPAINFHILRHTYGSQLAIHGAPLAVISQALGHRDGRMTERHYAHLSTSYVSKTIRKKLPKFGAKTRSKVRDISQARRA